MNHFNKEKTLVFKGAGFLLGYVLGIVAGIIVYFIAHNFVVALAASTPIGVALGISLEQRFQHKKVHIEANTTKLLWGMLVAGFLFFIAILLVTQMI